MARIVLYMAMSLDGFAAGSRTAPGGSLDGFVARSDGVIDWHAPPDRRPNNDGDRHPATLGLG